MRTGPPSKRTQDSRSLPAASFATPESRDATMNGQPSNLLLSALSPAYRASLLTRLKPVTLPTRTVLYEPNEVPKYAHFMISGMASVVSSMSNRSEERRVGKE